MKTRILTFAAGLCALAATTSPTLAVTVYVDQRFGPGGTGTSNAPHNTIQAAISNDNASVVVVYPGTYSGSLYIDKSLTILAYDGPLTTKVVGSAGVDTVITAAGLEVCLQGLNLSSGRHGVHQATSGTLYLKNCVICGNSSDGVYVPRGSDTITPSVFIYNCVIAANGGSGVYLATAGRIYYPNTTVFNTILIANSRYGLEAYTGASYGAYAGGDVILDFNCVAANVQGSYLWTGPGTPITFPTGAHSITQAPEFVGGSADVCNQDFRLLPTSPCKDTGHPGIGFLDPDGTRNDMGAYGGPGAQTFYTNPNDGPIVRSLSIDQGVVPKGTTFTIRASGAVR
jgi:hypothetical protein